MPPAGFEPAIPASERPQNHTLDRAGTGIGSGDFSPEKVFVAATRYKAADIH
jgi:hypothetical protein